MDNTTQLFIRACKSKNPYVRIHSVYKRFYGKYDCDQSTSKISLIHILSEICDRYVPFNNIYNVITDLNPNLEQPNLEQPNLEQPIAMLMSRIRLAESYMFKGLTTPAKFKRKLE